MRAFHYLVGNNLGVSACTRPAHPPSYLVVGVSWLMVSSPVLARVRRAVWAALMWLDSRVGPDPWDTYHTKQSVSSSVSPSVYVL